MRSLVLVAVTTVLLAVAVRVAWLGDDAYITLRTVENWCSGLGLRWNLVDRVQTFTHPLWMLLLAAGRALTGEVYFTTLGISLALSTVAIVVLLRRAGRPTAMLAIGLLLLGTRAFTDYTTSGLETPLTSVLLLAFAGVVLDERSGPERPPRERFGKAALLAALLATNRMDLALVCAPALLAMVPAVGVRPALVRALAGGAPFFAWLLFAAIWFGSPFPVTAHAKAFGVGIPALELAQQGLRYATFALRDDPLLLPAIVLGLVTGLRGPGRWLAVGALLYCGYVVKVGGDFMAGRFFLPPFVVAMAILAPSLAKRPQRSCAVAIGALLLAALGGLPQWLRSPASDTPPSEQQIEAQHGIVDERRIYYPVLGLFSPTRQIPVAGALEAIAFPEGRSARWLLVNGAVGIPGYQTSPRGHLLDPLLCDPLLTRLPARDPAHWRIGHVLRRVPEGYYETVLTGENRLHHEGLRRYYDALRTLTQAPVFAGERLTTLLRMAIGSYDADFRAFVAEQYRQPPRLPVAMADLATPLPLGAYWFDAPTARIVYDGGLAVALGGAHRERTVQLQVAGHFVGYRLRFVREDVVVGEAMGVPEPLTGVGELRALAGMHEQRFAVPGEVVEYDTLWVDFVERPGSERAVGPAAIGALRLLP